MQKYSLCLVLLLFAAIANAAVQDRPDNNVNDVHHNFHEDLHLRGKEAELKIINLDKEEEELLGNYDDHDDILYDEDYDKDDNDEDLEWASGDDYDDEDEEEFLDDYEDRLYDAVQFIVEEEDDIPFDDDKDDEDEEEWLDDYEEEDDITLDDDKDDILYDEDYDEDDDDEDRDWASGDYYDDEDDELLDDLEKEDDIPFVDDKDDILYKYHAEDYERTNDHDFSIPYQPPQVRARDHGKPDKEDETVTVAELSPSSRNLLVSSVYFASGLAVFALFILAFIMYLQLYCKRQSAKQAQLPFVIQHGSGSSVLHSSIIKPGSIIKPKPGKYQPVATQESRSNHSIENDNSLFKQQTQLEEKLLP